MKKIFFTLVATILCLPAVVFAAITPADTGLQATGNQVYGTTPPSIGIFIGKNIITPIFAVSGTIFLVLMVYGGVLWMTAGGDGGQVDKAKKLLVNSVIGLIIMFSAYAITRFVFSNLT